MKKIKCMIFHHSQNDKNIYLHKLELYGVPIERVNEFNLLGLTIDQHMDWNAHIEGILPKGPYLPCVSMAGRAILAGYHLYPDIFKQNLKILMGYEYT